MLVNLEVYLPWPDNFENHLLSKIYYKWGVEFVTPVLSAEGRERILGIEGNTSWNALLK